MYHCCHLHILGNHSDIKEEKRKSESKKNLCIPYLYKRFDLEQKSIKCCFVSKLR